VLEILLQPRRNAKAAKRFFRKLLKGLGYSTRTVVADKLRSYAAVHRELGMTAGHETDQTRNNRAESSQRSARQMRGFKSVGRVQRILSARGPMSALFRHDRHPILAPSYEQLRATGCGDWNT